MEASGLESIALGMDISGDGSGTNLKNAENEAKRPHAARDQQQLPPSRMPLRFRSLGKEILDNQRGYGRAVLHERL